jgi:uroporphyrinogen III methyltransferase/synthase
MKIIVGTRGSKLAKTQTQWLVSKLIEKNPEIDFQMKIIKTKGDRILNKALDQIGDKGLFVKELEEELLAGKIDMAVHSMKDMPSDLPAGLMFGPSPKREDPRDVLLTLHKINRLEDLPKNSIIATGSKRRKYQLLNIRPDFEIIDIRGNVDTRIKKMKEQNLDGIVLAASGLKRINAFESDEYTTIPLNPQEMIPAPAQGTLAVEIREKDNKIVEVLKTVEDKKTNIQLEVERKFMAALEGSCHIPIGAYCETISEEEICLYGLFGREDGSIVKQDYIKGKVEHKEILAETIAKRLRREVDQVEGKVYLVGAGCGDPKLITVKGMEVLKQADTVIYDALANPVLLENVKENCELLYVGKRAGNHYKTQDEINQLIADKAKEGKMVVRLKGGDPYVFGRGGEEGEVLYEEGISFEVVPGVTSAIGGLAYAGIPITHRDCNTSFHVVTGHLKSEGSQMDWEALAKVNGTLVFLMGVSNMEKISGKLIEYGKNPDTPAAMVYRASMPQQKVITGTLKNLYQKAQEAKMKAPSLIVIGEVVEKRDKLQFFEQGPLYGTKTVVTRSRAQSSSMTEKITALGGEVIEYPAIKINPINKDKCRNAIKNIEKYTHLILTSPNGVEIFFNNLEFMGYDARKLSGLHITAIGSGTAKSLKKKGINPDFTPIQYVGEALVSGISPLLSTDSKILLPRSYNARPYIAEELSKICALEEIHTYETVKDECDSVDIVEMLENREIDYITFTSSTTVQYFIEKTGENNIELISNSKLISIGPMTTEKIKSYGLKVEQEAKTYTIDGVLECLIEQNKK